MVALAQDKQRRTRTLTRRELTLRRRDFSLVLLCLSPRFLFCWQHIKFYTSSASCLPQGLLVPGFHLPPGLWRQWGRVPLPVPCRLQPRQYQLCHLQATGKGSWCSVCALAEHSEAPRWAGRHPHHPHAPNPGLWTTPAVSSPSPPLRS